MSMENKIFILIILYLLVWAFNAFPASQVTQILVLIDSSGSFARKKDEAISKVSQLLDSLVRQNESNRLSDSIDHVSIISIDAIPEVIWEGNIRKLKKTGRKEWAEYFSGRKDYAGCTDVWGAFELAGKIINAELEKIQKTEKYIFIFSDLLHEAPKAKQPDFTRISSCERPKNLPDKDSIQWEQFKESSLTFFWVPAGQKFLWRKILKEHDLTFKLYTNSESGFVKIQPPPKVRKQLTAEEKEENIQALKSKWSFIKKFILVVGLITIFLILAPTLGPIIFRRLFGGRNQNQLKPASSINQV